mgnify:CR=1 FL=1
MSRTTRVALRCILQVRIVLIIRETISYVRKFEARWGHSNTVQWIIRCAECNIEAEDDEGNTALMWAVKWDHIQVNNMLQLELNGYLLGKLGNTTAY